MLELLHHLKFHWKPLYLQHEYLFEWFFYLNPHLFWERLALHLLMRVNLPEQLLGNFYGLRFQYDSK